jgi:hypothetical protein
MKVYETNYDGRVRRGVYTDTKKRALELLGVTAHQFSVYGIVREEGECKSDTALCAAPHTPMEARISHPGEKTWFPLDTFLHRRVYERECERRGDAALAFDEWFSHRQAASALQNGSAADDGPGM